MNTAELDSYSLDDAVKFNKDLNPRLWHKQRMRPDVRAKLLEIAADFKQSLGLTDLEVKDITVSGSNAGFTYTPHSDIDLHLVVDIPQADISDVYRELFDAKKYQYNAEHNITIGGYDVELYVENANVPPVSQGVYSIVRDDWINIPKRKRSTVNDDAVRSKYADIKHRIQSAVDSRDHDKISAMAAKIKKMRTAGLAQSGEMGPENLAYKMLRAQGWIKKLYDAKTAARDLELSLTERRKKKKRVRYAYGGYWAPGFAFGDGGGDGGGGGESIREVSITPDGVSPSTKMFLEQDSAKDIDILKSFAKYVGGELGLAKMPKIIVKRRPDWAEQNGSFGQYVPELNELTLSLHGRHIVDVLRTLAHELTHAHQQQTTGIPDNGGDTGSDFENEANARAGEFMRHFADAHPEYFDSKTLEEGMVKNAGAAIALAAAMAMTPAQAQQYLPQDQQQQVQQQGQLNTMQILNIARTIHSLKHNVTRAGAEEEINQEVKNYLRAQQGDAGAQNLSRLWQLQQRQQQKQQPQQQPWTGNQYQREDIVEASGYIPTDAEKNDPRFVMALSPDVRPGATGKNANKMALKTDAQGRPALLMKTANLREGRMPQPSQGPGKYRDLNEPLGPETPPTMPAGTVRIDVSDMYDWYKLGQHISNMKGLGRHDFGAGPPSSIISFGDEETEHKFIKDLKATGLDVTDIDPADPAQPAGMRRIKTDPTYNVAENKIKLSTDPNWYGAEVGDYKASGPVVNIPANRLVGFEPDDKMNQPASKANVEKIVAGLKQGAKLPPLMVRQYKNGYQVLDGHHRFWAYKLLGVKSIPAQVVPAEDIEEITKQGVAEQDELIESLRQEFALLEDEFLPEVKMSTANLRQLAAKTGAQAGMEFEMIVPNIEVEELEPEYEPDWDADQRARSFSDVRDFFHDGDYNGRRAVDDLIEELTGEYEEWVQEQIAESWGDNGIDYIRDFVEVNDLFDRDEAMAQVRDEVITANPDLPQESEDFTQLLSARLDELQEQFVLEAFEDQGRIYNDAFEAFADEQRDEYDERSFLDDKYPSMTDIENNFDIQWPYYYNINADSDSGEIDVDQVADEFSSYMGKSVNASSRYHGAKREPGKYVVEPDSSLQRNNRVIVDADGNRRKLWRNDIDDKLNKVQAEKNDKKFLDLWVSRMKKQDPNFVDQGYRVEKYSGDETGLEFVSPPMPIDEMFDDVKKVQAWAKKNKITANDSTGLHINISVPNYSLDKLDYVKLALLMGDEYVLDLFGRSGNTYAKAATDKIRTALKKNPNLAPALLDKMRDHMTDLATKAIHSGTTDKYTSINTKTGYIEFRSPGGDWLDENFDKIENTLLRFTVAMDAAMNPEKYRQEYLKKLYKLLNPKDTKDEYGDMIQEFAKYMTSLQGNSKEAGGKLSKETQQAIKDFRKTTSQELKQKNLARDLAKGKTPPGQKYWWDVSRPGYFSSIEVVASNKEEAIAKAIEPGNYPDWASARNTLQAKPLRPYQVPSTPVGTPVNRNTLTPTGPGPWEVFRRSDGSGVAELGQTNRMSAEVEARRVIDQRREAPELYGVRTRAGTDAAQGGIVDTANETTWNIVNTTTGETIGSVTAPDQRSADSAAERFIYQYTQTTGYDEDDDYEVQLAQQPSTEPQTPTRPEQGQQTFTGEWKIVTPDGREIHRFGGIGNAQSDANRVAIDWLRQNPRHMQAGVEVVPVMG